MAIGDISLTASARANLMSLQNTASLLGTTQARLSSGKKVNSALDNASSFFASQGFLNSANDLAGLKDSMATALQTIKSASDAITSITNVVNQMQGIANSALQSTDSTSRDNYATQFNSLMTQLDGLVTDSTFNGTNLLESASNTLTIFFDATNTTSLTVQGVDSTSSGLGIKAAGNKWVAATDIQTTQSLLQTALTTLRTNSASFGNNNTIVQTRSNFTTNLINTLQTASDNLILADTNEEGANLQSLQAQNQLGIVALGISGQLAQAILKLF
ncbi:MAG: flagellin [Alphaproteobacteria bacterium]|nr:flagellin [Alphaproteobacteria bacterium]